MGWLDEILRLFGTNRVRVRWRWNAAKARLARSGHTLENRARALEYRHGTCRDCGHPAGADDPACVRCGGRIQSARRRNLSRVLGWLVPEGFPVVTASLVVVCAALYVLTVKVTYDALDGDVPGAFAPSWPVVYRYGGNSAWALLKHGQWWRLVTSLFLHLGVVHIAFNSVGLWIAGSAVEECFGRARALFVFLVTGVLGFCASLLWYGPTYAGAGASGAVFGLIGAMVGHGLRYRGPSAQTIRARFVPWAIYGIVVSAFIEGVDNAAHMGGLVVGLGLGALLADVRQVRRAPDALWRAVALLAVAVIVGSLVLAAHAGSPGLEGR